jgi:hypothetical protein
LGLDEGSGGVGDPWDEETEGDDWAESDEGLASDAEDGFADPEELDDSRDDEPEE